MQDIKPEGFWQLLQKVETTDKTLSLKLHLSSHRQLGQLCFAQDVIVRYVSLQEVYNLLDMFYVRKMLHQRACQHKTAVAIELMCVTISAVMV